MKGLVLSPRTYSSGWTPPAPSGAPMLRGTVKPLRARRGLVLTAQATSSEINGRLLLEDGAGMLWEDASIAMLE